MNVIQKEFMSHFQARKLFNTIFIEGIINKNEAVVKNLNGKIENDVIILQSAFFSISDLEEIINSQIVVLELP